MTRHLVYLLTALQCLTSANQAFSRQCEKIFGDPKTLVNKLIPAIEKADVKQIAAFAFCETRVGPWESETSPLTPKKVADYLAKARRIAATSRDLLPFKVVQQRGNKKAYLLALGGFSTVSQRFQITFAYWDWSGRPKVGSGMA